MDKRQKGQAIELCQWFIDRHAFGSRKKIGQVNRHVAYCQHDGCRAKRAARAEYEAKHGRHESFHYGLD